MTDPIIEELVGKRKTYQKPQVQRVALVPNEAVLADCKTTTIGNLMAFGGPGTFCGIPVPCPTAYS